MLEESHLYPNLVLQSEDLPQCLYLLKVQVQKWKATDLGKDENGRTQMTWQAL